jgi:hypothetical protein
MLYLNGATANGIFGIGDVDGIGNATALSINDPLQTATLNDLGQVSIGDYNNVGNNTLFGVNDATKFIGGTTQGSVEFGDLGNQSTQTTSLLDVANQALVVAGVDGILYGKVTNGLTASAVTFSHTFSGSTSLLPLTYTITVDSTGTPDTFSWTDGTNFASNVPMSTSPTALSNGMNVSFDLTTGNNIGEVATIEIDHQQGGRGLNLDMGLTGGKNLYEIGDIDKVNNGNYLSIDDHSGQSQLLVGQGFNISNTTISGDSAHQGNAVFSATTTDGADHNQIQAQLGDISGAGNSMYLDIQDFNNVTSVRSSIGRVLLLDVANSIYAIGDYDQNNNGTALVVDDGNREISMGDVGGNNNNTLFRIDDNSKFITFNTDSTFVVEDTSSNVWFSTVTTGAPRGFWGDASLTANQTYYRWNDATSAAEIHGNKVATTSSVTFTGSGINDLSVSGTFTGPSGTTYSVIVDGTNFQTVPYTGASGPFTVGETVTETPSGFTGVVVSDSGSILILSGVTGAFTDGHTITGGTSTSTATTNKPSNIYDTFSWSDTNGGSGSNFD